MINAAIIGLGRWGKNLVNSVQGKSDRLRFARAMVRHPDAVRDFAAQHGLELSADFNDTIGDPRVQAVVITTPHSLHTAQIIAAAGAGKAVFCEKPLALTKADAQAAADACGRAGVLLGVGHDKRFWPSMREVKRVVAGGELGQILHVEGHFSNEGAGQSPPWRALPVETPGAGLTATGIHIVDAFTNLVGPARRVYAQVALRKPQPHALDTVSILYEFANGVSGMLATVRVTPWFWRVHVFGDRGSAEAVGQTALVLRMPGAKAVTQTFEPVDTLRLELEAFADALEGRAPYPIPIEQIIDTVASFEASVNSMESGTPVLLDRL